MKKKMSPAEFIKYAAENHIKFELHEDNRKFHGQQCQDEDLNEKFRELHVVIVNQIISFCKENNIVIDEFHLNADCLEDSIKAGSWQPCTDSCFIFDKYDSDYKKVFIDMDNDFVKGISEKTLKMIEAKQEPYLRSM